MWFASVSANPSQWGTWVGQQNVAPNTQQLKPNGDNKTHTHPQYKPDPISQQVSSTVVFPPSDRKGSSRERPKKAKSIVIGLEGWKVPMSGSTTDPQHLWTICLHHLLLQQNPPHPSRLEGIDFLPSFSLSFFFWICDRELQTKSLYSWKPCGWQMHEAINPCAGREGRRGAACKTHPLLATTGLSPPRDSTTRAGAWNLQSI